MFEYFPGNDRNRRRRSTYVPHRRAAPQRGRARRHGEGAEAPRRQPRGRRRTRSRRARPTSPRHIGIVNGYGLQAVVGGEQVPDGYGRGARARPSSRHRGGRVRGGDQHSVRGRRSRCDCARRGRGRGCRRAERVRLRLPARRADRGEDPPIATRVYGADGVELLPPAKKKAADWATRISHGFRSAWRRRTSRSLTTPRSTTRRPASP